MRKVALAVLAYVTIFVAMNTTAWVFGNALAPWENQPTRLLCPFWPCEVSEAKR